MALTKESQDFLERVFKEVTNNIGQHPFFRSIVASIKDEFLNVANTLRNAPPAITFEDTDDPQTPPPGGLDASAGGGPPPRPSSRRAPANG